MNKAYGKIVSNFSIDGSVKSIEPLGNGLINDTFKVTTCDDSTPDYGDFLDFCFSHFTDVAEYPGIQSLCLKLAHRMCRFYPELMGELKRTLEAMEISEYSPALRSVRSRILSGKLK